MTADRSCDISGDAKDWNKKTDRGKSNCKTDQIPDKNLGRLPEAVENGDQSRIQIEKRTGKSEKSDVRSGFCTVKKYFADPVAAEKKE